jgi:hypothetical protein
MPTVEYKIPQGSHVRDKVTGFTGTVVVQSFYLNKCIRYGVQPKVSEKEPEKIPEVIMFDEAQLVVLEEAQQEPPLRKTGGPQQAVREAR